MACSDRGEPAGRELHRDHHCGRRRRTDRRSRRSTIEHRSDDVSGSFTFTQNFSADPGWTTAVTAPDNAGLLRQRVHQRLPLVRGVRERRRRLRRVGRQLPLSARRTRTTRRCTTPRPSTRRSSRRPVRLTLQFRTAYRTEVTPTPPTVYDGAIVQYKLGAGDWTTLAFSTPGQVPTTTGNFCSPLVAGSNAWGGTTTGTAWILTNAAAVPSVNGQSLQFRWRLGSDVSVNGHELRRVRRGRRLGRRSSPTSSVSRTTTRTRRAASRPASSSTTRRSTLNLCVSAGIRIQWPKDPDNWGDGGAGTRTYDVLRDGSPIATGIAYGTTTFDDATAVAGTTYTYTVRYKNGCGSQITTTGASRPTATTSRARPAISATTRASAPRPPAFARTRRRPTARAAPTAISARRPTPASPACASAATRSICFQLGSVPPDRDLLRRVCNNPLQPDGTALRRQHRLHEPRRRTAGSCAGSSAERSGRARERSLQRQDDLRVGFGAQLTGVRHPARSDQRAPGRPRRRGRELLPTTTTCRLLNDATTPAAGQGFFYLVRAANACGQGNYRNAAAT